MDDFLRPNPLELTRRAHAVFVRFVGRIGAVGSREVHGDNHTEILRVLGRCRVVSAVVERRGILQSLDKQDLILRPSLKLRVVSRHAERVPGCQMFRGEEDAFFTVCNRRFSVVGFQREVSEYSEKSNQLQALTAG